MARRAPLFNRLTGKIASRDPSLACFVMLRSDTIIAVFLFFFSIFRCKVASFQSIPAVQSRGRNLEKGFGPRTSTTLYLGAEDVPGEGETEEKETNSYGRISAPFEDRRINLPAPAESDDFSELLPTLMLGIVLLGVPTLFSGGQENTGDYYFSSESAHVVTRTNVDGTATTDIDRKIVVRTNLGPSGDSNTWANLLDGFE